MLQLNELKNNGESMKLFTLFLFVLSAHITCAMEYPQPQKTVARSYSTVDFEAANLLATFNSSESPHLKRTRLEPKQEPVKCNDQFISYNPHLEKPSKAPDAINVYQCTYSPCTAIFKNRHSAVDHVCAHLKLNLHICPAPECNQDHSSLNALRAHIARKHKDHRHLEIPILPAALKEYKEQRANPYIKVSCDHRFSVLASPNL